MGESALVYSLIANHLWQSAVVAAALGLLLVLNRRSPARSRHALTFMALIAAALLPFGALLPGSGLERFGVQFVAASPDTTTRSAATSPSATPARLETTTQAARDVWVVPAASRSAPAPAAVRPAFAPPRIAPALCWALAVIWLAVALVLLVRVLCDVFAAERLRRAARPVTPPRSLPAHLRALPLAESEEIRGPLVAGLLRPTVIVPAGSIADYDALELRAFLEHERSHIERGDLWVSVLQRVLLALLWWSPAMRWINRRIEDEREMACDDDAVASLGDGRLFARALADHAHSRLLRPRRLVLGMARRSSLLVRRVRRLTTAAGAAGAPAHPGFGVLALAAVITLAAIATPRLAATGAEEPPKTAAPHLTVADARDGWAVDRDVRVESAMLAWEETQSRVLAAAQARNGGQLDAMLEVELENAAIDLARAVSDFVGHAPEVTISVETENQSYSFEAGLDWRGYADLIARLAEAAEVAALSREHSALPEPLRALASAGDPAALAQVHAGVTDDLERMRSIAAAQGDVVFAERLDRAAGSVPPPAPSAPLAPRAPGVAHDAAPVPDPAPAEIVDIEVESDGRTDVMRTLLTPRGLRELRAPRDAAPPAEAMVEAALTGDQRSMIRLASAGGDVNAISARGESVLAIAVGRGDAKLARSLLLAGADPDLTGPDGDAPLIMALKAGDAATARTLIDLGADVDALDAHGRSALLHAIEIGDADLFCLLISAGADVNLAEPSGATPLIAAARVGRSDFVRELVEHGADVNARDDRGVFAIEYVLESGDRDVAVLLLQEGAVPARR